MGRLVPVFVLVLFLFHRSGVGQAIYIVPLSPFSRRRRVIVKRGGLQGRRRRLLRCAVGRRGSMQGNGFDRLIRDRRRCEPRGRDREASRRGRHGHRAMKTHGRCRTRAPLLLLSFSGESGQGRGDLFCIPLFSPPPPSVVATRAREFFLLCLREAGVCSGEGDDYPIARRPTCPAFTCDSKKENKALTRKTGRGCPMGIRARDRKLREGGRPAEGFTVLAPNALVQFPLRRFPASSTPHPSCQRVAIGRSTGSRWRGILYSLWFRALPVPPRPSRGKRKKGSGRTTAWRPDTGSALAATDAAASAPTPTGNVPPRSPSLSRVNRARLDSRARDRPWCLCRLWILARRRRRRHRSVPTGANRARPPTRPLFGKSPHGKGADSVRRTTIRPSLSCLPWTKGNRPASNGSRNRRRMPWPRRSDPRGLMLRVRRDRTRRRPSDRPQGTRPARIRTPPPRGRTPRWHARRSRARLGWGSDRRAYNRHTAPPPDQRSRGRPGRPARGRRTRCANPRRLPRCP
jgi:hypothetical protein